jgi:hypothetical protein
VFKVPVSRAERGVLQSPAFVERVQNDGISFHSYNQKPRVRTADPSYMNGKTKSVRAKSGRNKTTNYDKTGRENKSKGPEIRSTR